MAAALPLPRPGPRDPAPVTIAILPVSRSLIASVRPPLPWIPSGGARGYHEPAVKRVLILTASYGSGHNAAARCLVRAFERERCTVTVVDHFRELVSPLFERASRALYYAMLRRAPLLWSIGYALGDWMASDSPLALGVTRLGARRLAALLESLWPDAVVTTHATPATAMSSLVAQGRRTPPHTSVVTDFVAHSQWIARHIDCYCVAADEGKLERLTDGTRVRTLGYTDDVRRLMVAADLLVTKAGGLTLAEAMAAELPVLAYGSLPGQERRNERFAARAGIGLVARSYLELVRLLDRALGDPDLLERLRARIRGVRRPDATQRVVSAVLEPLGHPAGRP